MEYSGEHNKKYSFLAAKGEMARLTREKDWSQNPVGPVETWPQSLRTTLSIVLRSKFPKFLWWGPELICFYNDAFRPSLGENGKHPHLLGMSCEEGWPEIWDTIHPILEKVLENDESIFYEDQLIPISRNGKLEDVYWTFSYTPIIDESGKPAGVLVTTIETTDKVNTLQKIKNSEAQLNFAINAAELGTWYLNPATNEIEVNERLKNWFGLSSEKSELNSAVASITDQYKEKVSEAIAKSLRPESEGNYEMRYKVINPETKEERTLLAIGKTFFTDDKVAYQFSGIVQDITLQANSIEKLEQAEERLRLAAEATNLGIWEIHLTGLTMIYSPRLMEILGHEKSKVMTREEMFAQILPEDLPIIKKAFDVALQTSIYEYELRILLPGGNIRWIKTRGKMYYDENNVAVNLIGSTQDVTKDKDYQQALKESNHKILTFVENAPFPIGVYVGKEMRIEFLNQAIMDIWGKGNDLVGKLYSEILPEFENQQIFQQLDDVYSTGIPYHTKNQRIEIEINGNMEPFYFNYSLTPLFDMEGKVYGVMNTAADVTDLNIIKLKVEESESRFRLLADSMPQFVWAGDVEGNIDYFNQTVYDYSGLDEDQMKNGGWLNIIHEDERNKNIAEWKEAVDTGNDFIFEHRFRRSDGEYRWQLSRAVPLKDAEGIIQRWIGTSTDIHEMKAQEQLKDYFISMASHELKTPLTSIKGYVQILMSIHEKSEDAFLQKSLNTIDRQINKLTNLIADLLDLSKIKIGSLSLNKEEFLIKDLIIDITDQISQIYPEAKITIDNHLHQIIVADKERIGQVLINFLTNAIKYSSASSEIRVNTIVTEENILVSVIDAGIGISKVNQDKIFERFFRVEGKNQNTFPGFGIGLFICTDIIKKHGGKIGVNSEPGKGSEFYFSIPVK
ncbi:MAG: PAS domain S-box protein [Ginsengibacter sp.]